MRRVDIGRWDMPNDVCERSDGLRSPSLADFSIFQNAAILLVSYVGSL
jgi:hypothetical protein